MDTIKRFRSHLERSSRKSLNCKEHLIYLHGQILTSFPTKREDRLGNTGPRSWEYRPSAVRSVPKRLATTAKQLVKRVLQWKCQLHLQPLISFIIVFHNISSVISQEIIPILYVKDERTILLTTFTIEIFQLTKIETPVNLCQATGDPHYTTFDGKYAILNHLTISLAIAYIFGAS